MSAARAKVPTLAWLLTALTCLLAGMAIVESRHQAVALPVWAPVNAGETTEVMGRPTATPEPTLVAKEPIDLAPPFRVEAGPVSLSAGPALLSVERRAIPPESQLSFEALPGPTVVQVEVGILSIRTDSGDLVELELNASPPDIVLIKGERLIIDSDTRYIIRNAGLTTAVALKVTIELDPLADAE